MKTLRILYHLARADFLERIRRYSFLVMLGLVLLVGYIMASGMFTMNVMPHYRGVSNSAWVGATIAITVTFVLGLVGFYIVKGAVARDYETGVGQIMATTPMSRLSYMAGKWLSNLAVLGITAVIVALAGVVMVLGFGTGGLQLGPLLAPLLLIGLPSLAFVSALAVLFESVAWLRGGLGNIIYFFLWLGVLMLSMLPGALANIYTDFFGAKIIGDSVVAAAQAAYPDAGMFGYGGSIGVGELKFFTYSGIQWTAALLASRLLLVPLTVGLVLLAARLFDRFSPNRVLPVRRRSAAPAAFEAPAAVSAAAEAPAVHLTPLPAAARGFRFGALLLGELKLLVKGQAWWWYLVAAGLILAQLVVPADALNYVLIAAWLWPVLILSQLGCRENRFDTRQIVFSAPRPLSQLPAGWLSAVVVVALLGTGALVRFLIAGDLVAVLGWLVAIVFIPSLALALGVLTGSGKVFEALYAFWTFALIQKMAPLDFAGLVPGSQFYVYAAVAVGLLAIAALVRGRQLRGA